MIDRNDVDEGVVALIEPQLDHAVIAQQAVQAKHVFRAGIGEHLHVLIRKDGEWEASAESGAGTLSSVRKHSDSPKLAEWFRLALTRLSSSSNSPMARPKGHSLHLVAMTMLRDWLLDEPPRQLQELQRITGLSYPTVSTAVEQLGRWIRRGRYRTVALDQFPWEIWEKLVVQGNEARETVRFIDETGLGRSPSQLVERLSQLNVDVAIGGVAGARHYDHDMDLAGNPRLDLTIHQERGELATSWVKMIDPALERTDSGYQSASVLVHVLRRHDSLFDSNQLGQKIADPAECLLDLVDLRLDDQARRFADHFNKKIPIR